METWKLYAFASAVFAGVTSVLAKAGLKDVGADVGLAIRTVLVAAFVLLNCFIWSSGPSVGESIRSASARTFCLLGLSALATTLSWICYYRALKHGSVSFIAIADKGSVLITLLLSVVVLGETLSGRALVGAALVVGGLVVLASAK